MATRLFVGNLPPRLCFPELEDLFTPFGTIRSAELMTDQTTGRSRGFGFVEMETAEAAHAAIASLNGSEIEGQALTVNEAKAVQSRFGPRGGGGGSSERPAQAGPDRRPSFVDRVSGARLFIGNLPYTVRAAELETLLGEVGRVVSVNLITDRDTGQPKGFAFVDMESKEVAEAAIKRFDGQEALGRTLKVNEAQPAVRRPRPNFQRR